MQTIKLEEILNLYQKCGITAPSSQTIRTTINKGTLENKLNTSYEFLNKNSIQTIYTNNTASLISNTSHN